MQRSFKDVCNYLNIPCTYNNEIVITDIEIDSRKIVKGDLFYAVVGHHVDGRDFILDAKQNGAVGVLLDKANMLTDEQLSSLGDFPVLVIGDGYSIGAFANWFYGYPSYDLKVIGVTGTNGKTTCSHMLAYLLNALGYKCAVMGTVGYGFLPNLEKSANTTLNEIDIQRVLRKLLDDGAQYVAMEVSSIGVCEQRVKFVQFTAGGFSNLTRDHLDYHGTMEEYAKAKLTFLNMINKPNCIAINIHDSKGREFVHNFQQCFVFGYRNDRNLISLTTHPYIVINSLDYHQQGIDINLEHQDATYTVTLPLLGAFNAENYLLATSILCSMGFLLGDIIKVTHNIKAVKGRMECFRTANKPTIVVDYAHTPDGVEQVLKAVKSHFYHGNIYCVIGCGGDRDRGKRSIMAQKACVYSDYTIFTEDNPRSEDPKRIIADMLIGVKNSTDEYEVILDRKEAIEKAFSLAKASDCVVVAGKGHEDYQIFKNKTIHFSDREIACSLLGIDCD